VMDILLSQRLTAADSLALAKSRGWRFYRSLHRYAASFSTDPEGTLEILQQFAI